MKCIHFTKYFKTRTSVKLARAKNTSVYTHVFFFFIPGVYF